MHEINFSKKKSHKMSSSKCMKTKKIESILKCFFITQCFKNKNYKNKFNDQRTANASNK